MELIDSLKIGTETNVFTTPYGECTTSEGTIAKTVTVSNFKLATGAMINVKFPNGGHTASSMTLNVNDTGAKTVLYNNNDVSSGLISRHNVYTFIYDGTNFRLLNPKSTSSAIDTDYRVSSVNAKGKIYLVGTTTQTQTNTGVSGYSNTGCFASGGALYSEGVKVSLEGHQHLGYDNSSYIHFISIEATSQNCSNASSFNTSGGRLMYTGKEFEIDEFKNGGFVRLKLDNTILIQSSTRGRTFDGVGFTLMKSDGTTSIGYVDFVNPIGIDAGGEKEIIFFINNINPDNIGTTSGLYAEGVPIRWDKTTNYFESYASGSHTHTYSQVGAASAAHTHTSQNYAVNFGICTTTAPTTTKYVTITGIGSTYIPPGTRITVKFMYANSNTSPTLSINSGAANKILTPSSNLKWVAGAIIDFVYYNASWYMMSSTPVSYTSGSTIVSGDDGGLGTS